ncbi:sec-independent translocase [Streptomyces sp. NBC_00347]|uniref:sec-independent translocase n=1 Tax=Streptomyces sp. NBC_00347 TaxID=2975721 RepID=UPI00225456D7|nr:sec-independent translocase [Streptomyces sp. NBC_00347]MCX5130394.1 sec-independent translocase [Streptomyces sp. NBC_00347]
MFNDIGALELITLVILAVLVFGPEKLPKMIQDVTGVIRKVRAYADSAKADIRSGLGPEFEDFEFRDLDPKNFARKHLLDDHDGLGLEDTRKAFDLRKEMSEVADAVNHREDRQAAPGAPAPSAPSAPPSLSKITS